MPKFKNPFEKQPDGWKVEAGEKVHDSPDEGTSFGVHDTPHGSSTLLPGADMDLQFMANQEAASAETSFSAENPDEVTEESSGEDPDLP